jgi:predicted nucleic acid-binding protein
MKPTPFWTLSSIAQAYDCSYRTTDSGAEIAPRVCRDTKTGNLAFHAEIAALCEASGFTLVTADRDFSRFGVLVELLG